MADELRMALLELLRKAELEQDADFLHDGGGCWTRPSWSWKWPSTWTPSGTSGRRRGPGRTRGYRERQWDPRVGTIELPVPRVRDGSYFPRFAGAAQAGGVDDLVQALGMQGLSTSQVSRLCPELDAAVERFRTRRLVVLDVGSSEDGAFWLGFRLGLVARGLSGSSWSSATLRRG
jgi:transposase-like protein